MGRDLAIYALLGLGAGALYALLGVGLVVTYKGSGVINFAHGAIAMFVTYQFTQLRTYGSVVLPWINFLPGGAHAPVRISIEHHPMGFVPSVIGMFVMAVLLGLLVHFLVFRPLRRASALGKVVGSVGLMLYLQAVATINFGTEARQLTAVLPGASWRNFLGLGQDYPEQNLWAAAVALVLAAVLWVLFRYTVVGTATRAAAENEKGAVLLGYSPDFLAGSNWVLASVLGGAAGLLFGPIAGALTTSGYTGFVVPALGAALVGGLSSIPLTTVGGIGLGVVESVTLFLANKTWWPSWLHGPGLSQAIPLLVIGLVLYIRGNSLPIRGSVDERRLPPAPRPQRVILWSVVGSAGVLLFGGFEHGAWVLALTTTMITAVLLLSYVVVTGYVGQISLIQIGLAGMAAFFMLKLLSNGKLSTTVPSPVHGWHLPMLLAMPIAIAVAVLVGVVVGLPAIRIRGVQLAVVTIAASVALDQLYFNNASLTGIAVGSGGSLPPANLFGLNLGVIGPKGLSDHFSFTVFVLVLLLVAALAVTNVRRSATGRKFLAVRANERAAAAAGVSVTRTKLLAFGFGAALAGLSGCLLAYQQQSISVDNFDALLGLSFLAFAYLGGISSVNGALVGGFIGTGGIVAYLGQVHFTNLTNYWVLLGGLGLIVTAILNPMGIAPAVQPQLRAIGNVRRWTGRDWARAAARLIPTAAIGAFLGWLLWDRRSGANAWPPVDGAVLALFIRSTAVQVWHAVGNRRHPVPWTGDAGAPVHQLRVPDHVPPDDSIAAGRKPTTSRKALVTDEQ